MTLAPPKNNTPKRIAIIGTGISGASAAWVLNQDHDVTVYESAARPGGHTATVDVKWGSDTIPVDTGFIVYNPQTYPDLCGLFDHLGVATIASNMGFSLSLDGGKLEWSGETLNSVFAQRRNLVSPRFLQMLSEILRFNRICTADRDAGVMDGLSIGEYLAKRRFDVNFQENYLIPMAAAIWSTPRARMLDYPAGAFVTFFENHRLIHADRPVWRTVEGGSRRYLEKLLDPLAGRVRLRSAVRTLLRDPLGVTVHADGTPPEHFDEVICATHSDQALALLGDASDAESAILGAIRYQPNRVVLHSDPRLMPRRKLAWSAWNYLRNSSESDAVCVTYWMNRLQSIRTDRPLFVTLNPAIEPLSPLVHGEWTFDHPVFSQKALAAQKALGEIQGVRNTHFAGAWTANGFHEDGLRSGLDAAAALGGIIPWRKLARMREAAE